MLLDKTATCDSPDARTRNWLRRPMGVTDDDAPCSIMADWLRAQRCGMVSALQPPSCARPLTGGLPRRPSAPRWIVRRALTHAQPWTLLCAPHRCRWPGLSRLRRPTARSGPERQQRQWTIGACSPRAPAGAVCRDPGVGWFRSPRPPMAGRCSRCTAGRPSGRDDDAPRKPA
jgi:hypothetical protein